MNVINKQIGNLVTVITEDDNHQEHIQTGILTGVDDRFIVLTNRDKKEHIFSIESVKKITTIAHKNQLWGASNEW